MRGATERALAPCNDYHLPLILMPQCRAHPQLDLHRQQRIAELVVAGASYWATRTHPLIDMHDRKIIANLWTDRLTYT